MNVSDENIYLNNSKIIEDLKRNIWSFNDFILFMLMVGVFFVISIFFINILCIKFTKRIKEEFYAWKKTNEDLKSYDRSFSDTYLSDQQVQDQFSTN